MTRMRTFGLCCAGALVISATSVAGASAAPPELGRCEEAPAGTGTFKDHGCQKEVKGSRFAWSPGPGAGNEEFSSRAGASTIETKRKVKITCKFATDFGRYTGPKEDTEVIAFRECTGFGGFSCNSPGAPPGVVQTATLSSVLGFIRAPKSVGVSLESSSAAPFLEVECHIPGVSFKMSITGSVIAPIKQVGRMSSTFTEKFKAAKGKQKPENFEGAPKDTLTCVFESGSEPCGLSITDTIKNIEPLEINPTL